MKTSIFNEKNYLNNESIRKQFEDLAIDRKQIWELEKYKFHDSIEKYDELIEEIALFIKKMGYNSALDCSILISQLIFHGFLSYDLDYVDEPFKPEEEISYCLGTSIIRGKGCCRNLASMHKDIFQKLNLESKLFYCYIGARLFGYEKNRQANHVINLVIENDNLYGIDLYNGNTLFHFISGLEMGQISSQNNVHLLYKPYYELLTGESTIEDIHETIKEYEELSKKEPIKPLYYEYDIRGKTKKKVDSLYEECFNFHEKTKTLKKEIVTSIEKTSNM